MSFDRNFHWAFGLAAMGLTVMSATAFAAIGNIVSCVPPGPDNYLRVERWDGPEAGPKGMSAEESERHWVYIGSYYSQKNSGYVKIDGMQVDTNRYRDGHPYRVAQVISSIYRQSVGGRERDAKEFRVYPYTDSHTPMTCKPECKEKTACVDVEASGAGFNFAQKGFSGERTVWTDGSKSIRLIEPLNAAAGKVAPVAEAGWVIDVPVPGSYAITANIPQSDLNYSRHVEYVIEDAYGAQAVPVNQARFRGSWYEFGYFDLRKGQNRITLRNLRPQSGPMVADSISLRRTSPLSAPWPVWCNPGAYCQTVDNHEPGFSFNAAEDPGNVALGLGHNKQMVWVKDTSDPNQAVTGTWTFSIPQRGDYNVSVFIPVWFATSYNVTYTLEAGHETLKYALDQSENLGRWVHLGMVKFTSGRHTLSLSSYNPQARGYHVGFDAIGISGNLPPIQHDPRVHQIVKAGQCRGCNLVDFDFSNLEVRNIDFRGADLKNVTFSGSDISGSDFTGANLPFAKFTDVDSRGTKFANGSLEQADFRAAILEDCAFQNTRALKTLFTGASFIRCQMSGIQAERADFSHAFFRDTVVRDRLFKMTSFQNAQFIRSDFLNSQFID